MSANEGWDTVREQHARGREGWNILISRETNWDKEEWRSVRETDWGCGAVVSKHYDTSLYCTACFPACSLQIFINLAALSICVSNLAHTVSSSHCTQLCKLNSNIIYSTALSEMHNQLPTQCTYQDNNTQQLQSIWRPLFRICFRMLACVNSLSRKAWKMVCWSMNNVFVFKIPHYSVRVIHWFKHTLTEKISYHEHCKSSLPWWWSFSAPKCSGL